MAGASNVSYDLTELEASAAAPHIGPHGATSGALAAGDVTKPTAPTIYHLPPPKPWREMTADDAIRYCQSIGWGGGVVGGAFVGQEIRHRAR
jgi:hypothetical protein